MASPAGEKLRFCRQEEQFAPQGSAAAETAFSSAFADEWLSGNISSSSSSCEGYYGQYYLMSHTNKVEKFFGPTSVKTGLKCQLKAMKKEDCIDRWSTPLKEDQFLWSALRPISRRLFEEEDVVQGVVSKEPSRCSTGEETPHSTYQGFSHVKVSVMHPKKHLTHADPTSLDKSHKKPKKHLYKREPPTNFSTECISKLVMPSPVLPSTNAQALRLLTHTERKTKVEVAGAARLTTSNASKTEGRQQIPSRGQNRAESTPKRPFIKPLNRSPVSLNRTSATPITRGAQRRQTVPPPVGSALKTKKVKVGRISTPQRYEVPLLLTKRLPSVSSARSIGKPPSARCSSTPRSVGSAGVTPRRAPCTPTQRIPGNSRPSSARKASDKSSARRIATPVVQSPRPTPLYFYQRASLGSPHRRLPSEGPGAPQVVSRSGVARVSRTIESRRADPSPRSGLLLMQRTPVSVQKLPFGGSPRTGRSLNVSSSPVLRRGSSPVLSTVVPSTIKRNR